MSSLDVMILFDGHKSILTYGGVNLTIHEGSYAIDIKRKVQPKFLLDDDAFNIASKVFFDVIDEVTKLYDYKGFSVEGKYSRWLKPLIEINGKFITIQADLDDYVSFYEKIIQSRLEAYATEVISIKKDIELIYANSKTIDEMINLLNNVYER